MTVNAAAFELPAAGQYGLVWGRFGIGGEIDSHKLRAIAAELEAGRRYETRASFRAGGATRAQLPNIVRGLRAAAALRDWLDGEGVNASLQRLSRRTAASEVLRMSAPAQGGVKVRGSTDATLDVINTHTETSDGAAAPRTPR